MPTAPVALITGSGKKRVGWHIADRLAGRGYRLAIHYRSAAAESAETVEHLRGRGVEAEAFAADLSDEQAVREMVESVLMRFGRIDVLVNAAAIWRRKKLEDVI